MFNGMMDPELIKMAQEQMSRMSPAELAKIQQQMMSNPDLLKMASESMQSMRPEDLKQAAEQMKYAQPEEIAKISEKFANATPDELASIRARVDAQMSYEINGAEMLKKQGNELHGQGKYHDASQKYLHAKKNLKGIPAASSRTLLLACSLNLMSCYLKLGQYNECVKEGSEVLSYDAKNVKALYRRGQAYKELRLLDEAVTDLSRAHEFSPDDDTIAEVLRDAERCLNEGGNRTETSSGLIIQDITEEVDNISSKNNGTSSLGGSRKQLHETSLPSRAQDKSEADKSATNLEYLQKLKDDPDTVRSFQNFISSTDPDTLAKMGAGKVGEIPPDMLKTASSMIGRMSPDELQNMIKMASSFQGENPFHNHPPSTAGFGPDSVPGSLNPEMMKAASEMMSKMSPEEYQKMFEMASSLKQREPVSNASPSTSSQVTSDARSRFSEAQENIAIDRNSFMSGSSSFGASDSNARNTAPMNFPMSTTDMQEQMRNQMKDPATRQMFASMMKNISPDMMASMGEQFGLNLSKEDAAKAQQAMASLSPEALDKMMKWADRIQRGVEGAKKTKNWVLGKPGVS
ncbi:hypothetical protein V2J09_019143 [Rumex salicifolius]